MKRIIDMVLVVPILLFLAPVFLLFSLLVRYKLGAPVFFRQIRVGKDGRLFEMVKFRTMIDSRNENGEFLPDAERLTDFGKFLRSSSLDELPELWNVLKGDMSLVGPRPLLKEYLPLYSKQQARRHEVRPGITGWAQVNGRNTISWEEKFELDVWYVENQSSLFDVQILWMTIHKVINHEGITADNDAAMPVFTGSKYEAPDK